MWKALLLTAFVANTILIVSSTGTGAKTVYKKSSSSSSTSSSTSSSSSSYESSITSSDNESSNATSTKVENNANSNSFNSNSYNSDSVRITGDGENYSSTNVNSASLSSGSYDSNTSSQTVTTSTVNNEGDKEQKKKCPRRNERWVQCPEALCQPQNCTELGFPVPCPVQSVDGKCPGKPGCICNEGYLRNEEGVCVPKKECPSCGGDPNAQSGCGVCDELCSGKQVICPRICKVNACNCKKGYKFDENLQKCVLPEDCSPICGPDEVFDSCATAGCHSGRTCKDLDRLNGSTICIDLECEPGCLCKQGYLRNDEGVCVPENKCPNSKCKNDNERYTNCPALLCTPQTCDELGFPIACPDQVPGGDCPDKPGCVCTEGHVRNSEGKCIPQEECPSCGGDTNAVPGCGMLCVKKCSNYWKDNLICPLICEINGCTCKEGLVYDENTGKCVNYWDCTQVCGQNEEYSTCTNGRCVGASNCTEDINTPVKCVKIDKKYCKTGCVCQKGFLRNKNGVCVAQDECPSNEQCKGRNVFYDTCPPNCAAETCDSIDQVIDCPPQAAVCRPRCRCAKGYYKDKNGECILEKDCLKCKGPNEHFSCGGACDNECSKLSQQNQTSCPIINVKCNDMCYCDEGYARANNGTCVPIKSCRRCQGAHEYYDECPPQCLQESCDVVGKLTNCALVDGPLTCKPICRCEDGYYRNSDGKCVPKQDCPCNGDPNATSGCGNNCGRLCSNYNSTTPVACTLECNLNGCDCRKGYVLDENTGKCVLPEQCTPKCKKPNEEYNICPAPCPGQSCDVDPRLIKCAAPPKPGDPNCEPGCLCKDGYFRNKNGDCVLKKDCPCNGDPNATSGCGKNCGRLCSNYNSTTPVACTLECNLNGCDCRKGYVLDENTGKCVLPEQCTPKCKKPNEEYNICPAPCPGQSCDVDPRLVKCAAPPKPGDPNCEPGCVCQDGYFRNKNGDCVLKKDCPCNGDPNATSGCGKNCGRLCSNYNSTTPVACTLECNLNGCDCRKGYVLDENTGKCVLPEQCTPKCKKPNEEYNICPAPCPGQSCDVDPRLIKCAAPPRPGDPNCEPGCVCKDGYLRNKNGDCVLKKDCPKCNGANEEWDPCPDTCAPKTCDSIGKRFNCPLKSAGKNNCKGQCRCKPNFYRNKLGQCISEKNCLKCKGPNEHFSCGGACDNVCSTLSQQNQTNCPIINAKCNDMCYCDEGYARSNNGTCVPIKSCRRCRGAHEYYDECPPQCLEESCDAVGKPTDCALVDGPQKCNPVCRCEDGYYRNKDGKCIPKKDCPCGGDPNATSGCGINCGRLCSNYNTSVSCIQICYENACDCRKGYVLDDYLQKCVRPKDCLCPLNERFSSCIQAECRPLTCEQRDKNLPCPRVIEKYCKKGCVCTEGYLRDKDGKCVPVKDCQKKCPRPNERWEKCPAALCQPQNCTELGYPVPCPVQSIDGKCSGEPGCICIEGYLRNEEGDCVPKKECPSCGGDPNAEPGCGVCDELCSGKPVKCPKICKVNACNCKKGYKFDENLQKCVLPEDCSPICGPDEVFDSCADGGCYSGRTCKDLDRLNGSTICVNPLECEPGCLCKQGYLRNDEGNCIPENKCPNSKCKNDNERWNNCPAWLCSPQTCDELGFPISCPDQALDGSCPGKPGCICTEGHVRNSEGVCVPQKECPSCGGDSNAEPGCGMFCVKKCSNYWKDNLVCPLICEINGCTCKEGLVYDENTGKCVNYWECTQVCGQNEEYSTCTNGRCVGASNCTEDINTPVKCVKIDKKYCKTGCVCQKGFLRNNNGVCVAQDECPSNVQCKGRNEFYDTCPPNCAAETCDSIDQVIDCPPQAAVCRPRCRCAKGYYRDKNGECIFEKYCPKPCPKNEYWNGCANRGCYGPRNCSQIGGPTICVDLIEGACKGGCLCNDKYLRNDEGVCVPKNECPTRNNTCKANEVYDECPGKCPPRVCGIDDRLIDCAPQPVKGDPDCLPPVCRCQNGFYRNPDGNCVKWEDCPTCNNPNEVYDPCPAPCPPQRCDVDPAVILCQVPPQLGDPNCEPGCRCADGYVRNAVGVCITRDQCPKCEGPNEYFSCGGACDNVCSNYGQQNQNNCPIVNIKCNDMCYCEKDYARANNGTCVPIKSCRRCKGAHEYYDECPPQCLDESCESVGRFTDCALLAGDQPCKPTCRCEDDYFRDSNGDCVPKKDCPCNGDPNATSGCGNNCGRLCSNYNSTTPIACTEECNLNGCDCREGYVLDENTGKCVLPEQCTPKCKKPNEEYNICPAPCPGQSCDVDPRVIKCAAPPKPGDPNCEPSCICKDGYFRNKKGDCVLKKDCPCKGDPNATPGCGKNCGRLCSNYNSTKPVICTKECKVGGCDCREGFVLDENTGKCVLPEQCTPKCKGPNEHFSCGGACDNVCSTLSQQNQTNCPIINVKCNDMCYCDEGYARANNGTCVPIKSCRRCPGDHEYYDECPPQCLQESCDVVGKPTDCTLVDGPQTCNPVCRCEDGYYRNSDGKCVPKNECPCGGDPNATSGCGINCGRLCSNYNTSVSCIQVCYENGCDCRKGYVLDDYLQKCVKPKDCLCPLNERFSSCIQAECRPLTCDQRGVSLPCPRVIEKYCKKGCVCTEGYLRDEGGKCIPVKDCPCPGNAMWNTCPPQPCDAENCPQTRDDPQACVSTKNCGEPRCMCGFNQKRDRKTGNCIPIADCPPFKCDGPNEEFQSCPRVCPGEQCSDYLNNSTCPKFHIGVVVPCHPQCICKENFWRNSKGICVDGRECRKEANSNGTNTDALQQLIKGINDFAFKFSLEVLKTLKGKNIIVSPYSAQVPLAQLAMKSNGESLEQLLGSFNLKNRDQIGEAFKSLLKTMKGGNGVTFTQANKIFANKKYPLSDEFKQEIKNYFNTTAENIDCSQPEKTAAYINKWVEDNTNNLIKNLVPKEVINELVRLIVVNALYFKGTWKKEFNKNNTEDRDFYVDKNTTVKVPTMYLQAKLNYTFSEELNAQVLELRYVNENFRFVICLPSEIEGLQDTASKLSADTMKKALDSMKTQDVKVWMPTFKIDTSLELKEILQAIGLKNIFIPGKSGLDGILKEYEDLFVTAVLQKAYIEVNEEGSEAAAATGVIVSTRALPLPPPEVTKVIVNRPFPYFILYDEILIFSGAYVN